MFENKVKYVASLWDAALEEGSGNGSRGCITVLWGLVTLDELAASENGEMDESNERQRWPRGARLAGGDVLNFA